MRILYSILIVCFFLPYSAVADDAPAELVAFHQLKDAASKAYRNENWQLSFDTANKALAIRPLHPSILALILRTAQKLGNEGVATKARKVLENQGLDFIRPLKNLPPVGDGQSYYKASEVWRLPESLAMMNGKVLIGYVADKVIKGPDSSIELDVYGSPLGMVSDKARNRLWVSTSWLPQSDIADKTNEAFASLIEFDLKTLEVVKSYVSSDERRVFGSVAVSKSGSVYLSDSSSASLLELKGDKIVKVAGHSAKGSFQGIAPIRNSVYVADYSNGIYRYDLNSGEAEYLANKSGYSLITIDGLAAYSDNQLIAVQNGLWPHRILRLFIEGNAVACVDILASGLPEFEEPTNGMVVGDKFVFIANSQWPRFADLDNLPTASALQPAHLMSIDLEKAPSQCLVN